jgi:hypothetical protein
VVQSQRADSEGIAWKLGLIAQNLCVGFCVMGYWGGVMGGHGWEYPLAGWCQSQAADVAGAWRGGGIRDRDESGWPAAEACARAGAQVGDGMPSLARGGLCGRC